MPRTCTICRHEERHEIDVALVRRDPYRDIARRFFVSRPALARHAKEHLPALLIKANSVDEATHAEDLLREVRDLQHRALIILDKAEATGELRTALGAIREARGNLELLGRLAGELQEGQTINLYLSPEWLELRAVIVGALEPFSEAREAVLSALLEGSG